MSRRTFFLFGQSSYTHISKQVAEQSLTFTLKPSYFTLHPTSIRRSLNNRIPSISTIVGTLPPTGLLAPQKGPNIETHQTIFSKRCCQACIQKQVKCSEATATWGQIRVGGCRKDSGVGRGKKVVGSLQGDTSGETSWISEREVVAGGMRKC